MKTLMLTIILLLTVNVNAQNTLIPDTNFEQRLINLGYDSLLDGSVLTANISRISSLNLDFSKISDLTGIEGFTALTLLGCRGNQLTTLDLSKNINLKKLWCQNNRLTSIDISQNRELIGLDCRNNQLTSLDLSNNIALANLYCSGNKLTFLDVSKNVLLTSLICGNNPLTCVDVLENCVIKGATRCW